MVGNNQDRKWVKPELVRIGKIGDIAVSNSNGSSQCANGSPTCPNVNKS